MGRPENAVAVFHSVFNCAQAVFSAVSEDLGLDRERALKVAGAFGGGMGRMGLTCGAVTGAFMAIGLKHGKYLPEDNAAREKTYALAQEFTKRFQALHGSICCSSLLGCDIGTPEGSAYAKEHGLYDSLCPRLVADAVRIVEELLEMEK